MPMIMERVTQDGLFSLTISFNEDKLESYPADAVREIINVLEETAASIRFGLEHPEFKLPPMSVVKS